MKQQNMYSFKKQWELFKVKITNKQKQVKGCLCHFRAIQRMCQK